MGEILLKMYVSLAAPIIAGILNMLWCKLPILKGLKKPMDGGKCLSDGRRIFGDNKTWKGFIGYLILNVICQVGWGFLCSHSKVGEYSFFYINHNNTFMFNVCTGLLLGLGYALFELPNSFLKRRLDIQPGKTINGGLKVFFIFLDQADSVFGCCLVMCIFYPMSAWFYFLYVLVGALTHIVMNMLLYFMKLRKNMF